MTHNNIIGYRHTKPNPPEVLVPGPINAIKRLEYFSNLLCGNSRPIIVDFYYGALLCFRKLNHYMVSKLFRVIYKVYNRSLKRVFSNISINFSGTIEIYLYSVCL